MGQEGQMRLAMIGCGMISKKYFDLARVLPGVRFVATCARTEESAQRAAQAHQCERWFTDYQALLQWSEIDAVVITTPHWLHAPIALAAARAGKHILVEKPFATPSQWEMACELVAVAQQQHLTLMVLPYDLRPEFLTALQYVRPDILGVITAVEADFTLPGPFRSNWYYTREAEGGAGIDTLIYPLSRLAAIMGPAREIAAMSHTFLPLRICGDGGKVRSEVDDDICLLLLYPTGQHAVVRSCWSYAYASNGITIHGRYGDVFFNAMWPQPVIVHTRSGQPQGTQPTRFLHLENCYAPDTLSTTSTTENVLEHFIRCIQNGSRPQGYGRLALHLLEQTCQAYASARTGRSLTLTSSFERWWPIDLDVFEVKNGYW